MRAYFTAYPVAGSAKGIKLMQKRKYVYEPTGTVIETVVEISGEGWREIKPEIIQEKLLEKKELTKPVPRAKRAKK